MNFNTPQFTQVVEKALLLSSDSSRWQKAIERAADGLRNGNIVVTELAGSALVTTENNSYKVTGRHCQCPAYQHGNQPCRHRAARRLCALYAEAVISQQIEKDEITRAREWDHSGASYFVVRCGSWPI